MKINITYPHVEKKRWPRQAVIALVKWTFLGLAYFCVFLNAIIGGAPWSAIVLWALWTAWSFIIWPDLVECNRISLWIRLVTSTALLLNIIAVLFAPYAAAKGVPLVWFIGIAVAGVLFFTDFERQRQNMLPMLLLIAICLGTCILGLLRGNVSWELLAMGVLSLTILAICFLKLRSGLSQEVKKRFHTR